MVISTSDDLAVSQSSLRGVPAAMSMPTSRIASTATGLTWSAGWLPAERTSTSSPARWRSQPAAIWERPALGTQTNSTLGRSLIVFSSKRSPSGRWLVDASRDSGVTGEPASGGPERDVDQGDQHRHIDE